MTKRNERDDGPHTRLPFGICLGILFGVAVGMSTDNIAVWLPVGVTLGVCLGVVYDSRNKPHDDDGDSHDA
ncbi:hypothetical protein KIH77_05290 [Bifidobacterium sp. 82T24]|uniref:hypothetical protein n=1 Tax=Bifidobacterium pluvialisilvae TaxID=2834436 RepID=UPI001C58B808|nr:hypothetical protein [Bifidobacterium pluvialisilvae]MBW3088143.1 hypothetical protein [Bifidobacterium pluvialisilvae]